MVDGRANKGAKCNSHQDVPSFLEWMVKLFPEGSELDSGNAQANGLFAAYQPQANAASTTISAPGKVLVAGGYLVLDPSYSGLVIATSSRFYTTISTTKPNANKQSSIKVSSPQFQAASWEYSFNTSSTKSFVTPVSGGTNKFVELALDKTLKLIKAIKRSRGDSAVELERSLDIVIVGDNDFYSQRQQVGRSSTLYQPLF
jgi:phosphomevalonate kinase